MPENEIPTEVPFVITPEDAVAARLLWIELNTRVTTQPLHYRSGDEATAAESISKLFPTTRVLLAAHPEAKAFEQVALLLLNGILRPNTARWHPWVVQKFADEASRRRFRGELIKLLSAVKSVSEILERMQKGKDQAAAVKKLLTELKARSLPRKLASLGGEVVAGIGSQVDLKKGVSALPLEPPTCCVKGEREPFATGPQIDAAEHRFIHRRRRALGLEEKTDAPVVTPVVNATGLCLSGGGIRSATFCLGIVQALERHGVFKQFDYLSTVSGGGYLGTFLTSFLGTPDDHDASVVGEDQEFDPAAISGAFDHAFKLQDGRESNAVRHLRNNSNYLLNGGTWGRIKIIGLLITGVLTNLLLMLPLPLLGVLLVYLAKKGGYWGKDWPPGLNAGSATPAFTVFVCLASILTFFWFALPVVRNCARGAKPATLWATVRRGWETVSLLLGLLALSTGALVLLPWAFYWVGRFRDGGLFASTGLDRFFRPDTLVAAVSAVAPVVLGLVAAPRKSNLDAWIARLLFTLSGPLFYLVIFLCVGSRVLDHPDSFPRVLFITASLLFWSWLSVDVNDFSPHGYYRNRLSECYLAIRYNRVSRPQNPAERNDNGVSLPRRLFKRIVHGREKDETAIQSRVETLQRAPLTQMNATGAAPYHLINAAVNLPASHAPDLRGRDCDFYLFSRYYCGGPVCGYIRTEAVEHVDSHVDLATAMAISGAAASANMGIRTMRQFRFLLTLLNVRLGYWLRNPIAGPRNPLNIPGPLFLFRELTGWIHEKSGYLNLSDGGHIENLALYELLRRRCKFIVVVDGGMEPGMECADLMLAQRYAQIDLGVQFDLDIADLALNAARHSRAYAVFGKIYYNTNAPIAPKEQTESPVPADRSQPAGPGEAKSAGAAGTPPANTNKDDLGWLVYLKLARTGSEPGYVLDYGRENPDFPHQTTGDQFYNEAQFEAYRRLGECAAESLFRDEIFDAFRKAVDAETSESGNAPNGNPPEGGKTDPKTDAPTDSGGGAPPLCTMADWFQALATSLLADNDDAFTRDKSPDASQGTPVLEKDLSVEIAKNVSP